MSKRHYCHVCHQLVEEDCMVYGPDPYNSELHGDDTLVWECTSCNIESAIEV